MYGAVHHLMMVCVFLYIILMSLPGMVYESWKPLITNIFFGIMVFEFLAKLILNPKHVLSKIGSYVELGLLVLALFVPGVLVIFIFRFFVYVYTFVDHPVINRVIHTFLHSLPTLIMSSSVLGGCMFGYGLLANIMFGKDFPELFGNISQSFLTFIQLMTFDDWMAYILRPVMEIYPFAWIIFLSFIVLIVFGVLNIFVGTVVNAMSAVSDRSNDNTAAIKALRKEVAGLKKLILQQYEDNKMIK
jgi:voltage-gated sodium channel